MLHGVSKDQSEGQCEQQVIILKSYSDWGGPCRIIQKLGPVESPVHGRRQSSDRAVSPRQKKKRRAASLSVHYRPLPENKVYNMQIKYKYAINKFRSITKRTGCNRLVKRPLSTMPGTKHVHTKCTEHAAH